MDEEFKLTDSDQEGTLEDYGFQMPDLGEFGLDASDDAKPPGDDTPKTAPEPRRGLECNCEIVDLMKKGCSCGGS